MAKNSDGSVRVTREHDDGCGAGGDVLAPVPGHHLASLALHQADERTRLLVECSQLANRAEALDREMLRYVGWNKYPRLEDWQEGAPDPTTAAALAKGGGGKSAAEGLSLAGYLASFEASVWRQRAQQVAHVATDQDRNEIWRLLRLGLPGGLGALEAPWRPGRRGEVALPELAGERGDGRLPPVAGQWAVDLGWQAAGQWETAGQGAAGQGDWWQAVSRWAADFGWRGACQRLAAAAAERERELARDLVSCRAEGEARLRRSDALAESEAAEKAELHRARAELGRVRAELEGARNDLEGARAECDRLRRLTDSNMSQLSQVRDELGKAEREKNTALRGAQDLRNQLQWAQKEGTAITRELLESRTLRDQLREREREIAVCRSERDEKDKALASSERFASYLSKRCETMEGGLKNDSSTACALTDRGGCLQQALQDGHGRLAYMIPNLSPASTTYVPRIPDLSWDRSSASTSYASGVSPKTRQLQAAASSLQQAPARDASLPTSARPPANVRFASTS